MWVSGSAIAFDLAGSPSFAAANDRPLSTCELSRKRDFLQNIRSLPILSLGLCLSSLAGVQAGVTLLVKTDMSRKWELDGQPMSPLMAEDSRVVLVSPGEHLIQASTTDGVATIRTKVEVDKTEKTVSIQLKSPYDQQSKMQHDDAARKRAGAPLSPTWTDPATGLMWTRKDNGSDVDSPQATAYCSDLKLGSYKDWRLPTFDELQAIYDRSISSKLDLVATSRTRKGPLQAHWMELEQHSRRWSGAAVAGSLSSEFRL